MMKPKEPTAAARTPAREPVRDKVQKVLAAAGFASRRAVEQAIVRGEIEVNGRAAALGARVAPGDMIRWGQRQYQVPNGRAAQPRVILYHKPEGEMCTRNDPEGRPTVFGRMPRLETGRWVAVGRLDFNTSGLLLLTTDGELANKLMHPSTDIEREYLVRVQGHVEDATLEQLCAGVVLDDGEAKFRQIARGPAASGANSWFYCTVGEGRNREVRRLWESQQLRVSRLKRVRFGPLTIPSWVRQSQWLELSGRDLGTVYQLAGLEPPAQPKLTREMKVKRERTEARLRSGGRPNKRPKGV